MWAPWFQDEMKQLAKSERLAVNVSNAVNLVLFYLWTKWFLVISNRVKSNSILLCEIFCTAYSTFGIFFFGSFTELIGWNLKEDSLTRCTGISFKSVVSMKHNYEHTEISSLILCFRDFCFMDDIVLYIHSYLYLRFFVNWYTLCQGNSTKYNFFTFLPKGLFEQVSYF
jgi:hypothetical protein